MGNQTEADIQLLAGLDIDSSEAEILKAIKIIDKRLRAHKDARIKLIPEIDETVVTEVLGKLQTIFKSKDLSIDCKDSILNIQKEATAMMDVVFSANKAAKEKLEFTKANKKVEKSAEDTADAINRERQAMDNLDDLNYILNNINASGQTGNSVFQTFGNTLNDAFQTYTVANLLTDAIQKTVDTGKEAVEMTKEWDDASTSLRMATGASKETVDQYMESYNELGKEIGAVTGSVSNSADTWLRQGYNISDTNELIKSSMILSTVAQMDSADSAKYLTSSMKGYHVAVSDVIGIVDKLCQVDLNAAVSADGLAEGMSKVSAVAESAGISMDRLLGYLAVIGESSGQEMSSVGTALRTIFLRMQDIKSGKLELIDEDGTTELLSDVETSLKNVGIDLRATVTEFNNGGDVLDNLAQKWDTLSSVQQAALRKAFAGQRQGNMFQLLMENYDVASKYMDISANSTGVATEKFQAYLVSLESKTNSLKASLEELAHATISDELYASVLDTSKAVVDLTTDTGILKGLLVGLGTSGAIYTFQQLTRYLGDATQGFANLNEAMSMTRGGAVSINDMQRLIDLTGGLSQSQTRLLLSTTNLTDAQKISILMNQGMSQAQAQTFLTTNNLSAAQQAATTATVTLSSSLRGLWTTLLANPLVLVTTAVTAGVTAFNAYKNHVEEVRQATSELASAYKESTSSIDDYISRYQDLQKALQDAKGNEEQTASVKQQLLDLQNELNDAYGTEYGKLNLVTDAYNDQTKAIQELSKAEANRFLNENRDGISTATAKMEKEQDYVLSAPTLSVDTPDGKALQKIVDSYTDEGMRLIPDDATGAVQIVLKADAQTAYETLNNFETDLRNKAKELGNENLFDDILDFSTNALNNAKSTIDKYGEIYNQAQMANLVTDENASSVYEKALSAVEEYNNAVMASEDPFNDENVAKAKANVESVMAEAEGLGKYGTIFEDVFDQADRRLLDFNEKLKSDTSLQEWAEQLRGKEIVDLKSMVNDGQDDVFDKLVESAKEYGLEVEEVIDALVRLGYVQGNVQSSTSSNLFSSFDNTNLGERLQHASKLFKEGELTHKQYFDSLQNEIDNFDASNFTESLEDANKASQQFFTDTVQQSASGLSDLINKFDAGEMSVSEYLDGYLAIGETLSTLADNLQENSSAWDKNGEAMSDTVSSGLDSVQSDLDNAMSTITGYKDSIYSLEQIMTGAVKAGSDEFTAHANVIAQDLANIVSSGGEMASEVANTLGTTTSEIASNLTKNVSNQSLATQAIAANTNIAISDMATSVANIFTTLGNAISNFNVDISFSKTSGSLIDAITGNGELKFNLSASGETLSTIGDAISAFGETLVLNIQPQLIEAPDFSLDVDEYTPDVDTLKNYNDELDRLKDSSKGASKSTDALTESMQKQKDALESTKSELEKQKQYYEDVAEAIDWFYDKQISKQQKAIENLEKQIELVQSQIDIYDGALSSIDRFYSTQIEALEKKKDALAGNNKEVEASINLEKRQQELLEAKSRKTIGLYQKGKGIGYVTDTSAIKTAEENLAEAQRQKEEADIDAQINKLKEYQKLWAEIPSVKEKAEQDSQMVQLLGANWEAILLEGRIQNITAFKDQYVGLQQQINNNESMIASYEEKIAYYESLKTELDNLLAKYTEDTYTQLLIGAFGNDFENELLNGRTGRWTQFAEDYYNIQVQLKDVTDQIESLAKRMEDYASRIESAANSALSAVKKLKETEAETSSSGWYTGGWTSAIKSSKKAKGGIITKEDAGDLDFVAKSLGEDHMVALTEGEAVVPKETVEENPEAIDSLLSGQKLDLKALVNRDIVLQRATPLDNYSMFEKYKDWVIPDSLIMSRLNLPSQDFSKLGVVNNNQQQTVIQINGDLSFPNIKSGNDAELLLKDLSNMANKARQRSARR